MKYWLNKSATKNNIAILSAKALVVASTGEMSQEKVEGQLKANTHPKTIFGPTGFRVIPLAAITDFTAASSADTHLQISYVSKQTEGQAVDITISFADAKSKLECMGYIKKLTRQNNTVNKVQDTARKATQEVASKITESAHTADNVTNNETERKDGESPVSDIFTVKSADDVKAKPGFSFDLNIDFENILIPTLSLILALVATFLLYPKLYTIALVAGGVCTLSSLYFLYLGFKKSTANKDAHDKDSTNQSALSKMLDKVFAVVKPAYLLGLAVLAVTALYFLVPTELHGSASLYQAIKTHQVGKKTNKPIQDFLDNGADINYMAEDGSTPLITALNLNEEQLAIELINRGASLSTQYLGQTPLDLAIEASLDKAVSLMLSKKMVTSNPQDLLMRSISNGLSFENIKQIADSGMDINHKDEEGLTALSIALLFGAEADVIKLLLEHGASTQIKVGDVSPLEFAKLRGYIEISQILEKHSS